MLRKAELSIEECASVFKVVSDPIQALKLQGGQIWEKRGMVGLREDIENQASWDKRR